jgi:hypothetical protein
VHPYGYEMKLQPKPIQISPELAARCEGGDQAERMDKAFRAVALLAALSGDEGRGKAEVGTGEEGSKRLSASLVVALLKSAKLTICLAVAALALFLPFARVCRLG